MYLFTFLGNNDEPFVFFQRPKQKSLSNAKIHNYKFIKKLCVSKSTGPILSPLAKTN
jgi:hypothetical protein